MSTIEDIFTYVMTIRKELFEAREQIEVKNGIIATLQEELEKLNKKE